MQLYTIYKIVNKITGKVYIGFDSNYPNRINVHRSAAKTQDTKFYRAVRKYGWENFEHSVIYQSPDKNHTLSVMEPYYINEYNSFSKGYNSTLGGDGTFGLKHSKETRKIISLKNRVPKPQTKEHIERRIASLKLNPNAWKGMLGKHHTDVTKKLLSDNMKGKPKSQSHIENMKTRPQDTKVLECEHCGKIGDYKNMKRWHGDRCKANPNRVSDMDKTVVCTRCGLISKQSPNFYKYHNANCNYVQSPL